MDPVSAIYDPFRLEVIAQATLLPRPDEETFDRIARLASRLLGVGSGAVTIVHPEGQTFIGTASRNGSSEGSRGTPLRESYCRHVVETGVPLVVGDARTHPLLHDNPAIMNDAIAYAGVPVIVRGEIVGTVCAIDSEPRKWTEGDLEVLGDLVHLASAAIELRLLRGGPWPALGQLDDGTESRFLAIFEHSPAGMFLVSPDGGILRCNSTMANLLETDEGAIAGRQFTDFVHPEDREASLAAFEDVTSGRHEHRQVEERCVTPSGAVIWGRVTLVPVRGPSGALLCVLSMKDELSAEKRSEQPGDADEPLMQSQKLEALGQLAGGIAHDFNNMLTVITAYAGMALSDAEAGTEMHENLTAIEVAARQAAGLTQQLLSFSRRTAPNLSSVNLNDVVAAMRRMLTPIFPRSVTMEIDLASDLATVWADRARFEQVIMNLAVNARDAMPEGGTLSFSTRNLLVHGDEAESLGLSPGDYVELVVADTGIGIPESVLARVCDAFFTTKPAGKGTGLGLATVQRIVTQMGGKLAVASKVNEGTRIRIVLPALSA